MGVSPLVRLEKVGWAKAAETPARLRDVRSAVPTRTVQRVGTAERTYVQSFEHRGRLCPPYPLQVYFTVMVIGVDITGGTCGMWLQSPSTSCRVCWPGGSVIIASV